MREKIGVLLVDDGEGIAVQLFADPDSAMTSFKNLTRLEGNKAGRVTFFGVDYAGNKMSAIAKDLPLPEQSKEELPDGHVLGEGPIWFDKPQKKEKEG